MSQEGAFQKIYRKIMTDKGGRNRITGEIMPIDVTNLPTGEVTGGKYTPAEVAAQEAARAHRDMIRGDSKTPSTLSSGS